MKILDIVVLSRLWFEQQELFTGDCVISIASPGCEHPRLNTFVPRLNMHIEDITDDLLVENTLIRCIDKSEAKVIVDWFEEIYPWCDRLVVHCDAGISRSAGVAVGLSRFFPVGSENELRDKFPYFNPLVARLIWEECEERHLSPRFPDDARFN